MSIFYKNNKIDFIKNNHIYFNNAINYNIMQLEKKNLVFEIKQENISEQGIVFGIASTSNIDLDGDIIAPFAFQKSIDDFISGKSNIKILCDHDWKKQPGKITELKYQNEGNELFFSSQLYTQKDNSTTLGKDTFTLAKNGAYQFSVGFIKNKFTNIVDKKGNKTGDLITDATLLEISYVFNPANTDTKVLGTKSKLEKFVLKLKEPELLEMINNLKTFEDYQILCEDYLDMPRNIRKAFTGFFNKHIENEVETKTSQITKEFQKASDTNEPTPSDTNKVIDVKSNEIIDKIFKTLNIN